MLTNRQKILDELKRKTNPTDAKELIELILYARENWGKEEKEILSRAILDAHTKQGELALLRAFEESIMTEQQWLDLKNKGWKFEDIGTVLCAYFGKQEKLKDDDVCIVTVDGSKMDKERDFIKKNFGITVLTAKEALAEIEPYAKGEIDVYR